jgi:hypothetical protein
MISRCLATSWTPVVHILVGELISLFSVCRAASCPKATNSRDKTALVRSHGVVIWTAGLQFEPRSRSLLHSRIFWILQCVGKVESVNVPEELAACLLQGRSDIYRPLKTRRFNAPVETLHARSNMLETCFLNINLNITLLPPSVLGYCIQRP